MDSQSTNNLQSLHSKSGSRIAVLHLCNNLDYGDPAKETVTFAILSQRMGLRSLIASGRGELVHDAERAAVKHFKFSFENKNWFSLCRNLSKLLEIIEKENPRLIHAHGISVLKTACSLGAKTKRPLLIDLTQPFAKNKRTQRMMDSLKKLSYLIRVPSEMMKTFLIDNFTIDPAFIEKVPPGIDLYAYNPSNISMERIKYISDMWRLPDNSSILFLPLDIEHGHFTFLHALRRLEDKDFYAIIMSKGKKNDRDILEKYVMDLGLDSKVIIPEACDDWGAAFWLSNIVVAPNIHPMGQNLEVLQAQAVGRPVIITSVGANEEMVCKASTAWVVSADNVNALTRALDSAISMNREQMLALANNSRIFVEENFPQSVWINQMLKLYERLLEPVPLK